MKRPGPRALCALVVFAACYLVGAWAAVRDEGLFSDGSGPGAADLVVVLAAACTLAAVATWPPARRGGAVAPTLQLVLTVAAVATSLLFLGLAVA